MLHFRPKQWHIGDVHPYYENGTLYLFYLIPNGVLRCDDCFKNPNHVVCKEGAVAITGDFCTWHEERLPNPVCSVLPWDGRFLGSRGTANGMTTMESSDLVTWCEPMHDYTLALDTKAIPAGARDYSMFFDGDMQAPRATATAYFSNEHNCFGTGMDCGVMITGPLFQEGHAQRMLLHFPNAQVDLYQCKEPECSQMIHIGQRWVLLTSLARQSVHWVGAPTYWLGQANTTIDSQDWNTLPAYQLDGEDLCAAQLTPYKDGHLLFGWIPLNYCGQEWGGHLNLPRVIYPLPDGRLASQLEPTYAKRIEGEKKYVDLHTPTITEDGVTVAAAQRYTNFGVHVDFAPQRTGACGLRLDMDNGICVEIDLAQQRMRIVSQGEGRKPFEFSSLKLFEDVVDKPLHLHVIFDEDIVEAFLNDQYALCARVNVRSRETRCAIFAPEKDAMLSFMTYEFSDEAKVYTPGLAI